MPLIGEVSGGGLWGLASQSLDHGQYFFQNGTSTWHLVYTVIHNHLKIYYLHHPSGMLEH